MIKNNLNKGRVNQKLKTRLEILNAARALMPKNQKFTLEDVAKKANISRATVYRYYSSIDLLITEASLNVKHKSSEEIFEEVKDMSFIDRICQIQKHYNEVALQNEIVFRRYLSAVLSESVVTNKPLRGARRIETLNKALVPFEKKLGKENFRKLINTSAILMGIDPVLICRDVCKLNKEETMSTLEWALGMIVKGLSQPI